jgi:glycoprotein endo-alpha-1,2-mannosidase
MFMRVMVLASVVLLLSLPPDASAATWDNGGGDNLWSNATNWNPNVLPTISDSVSIAMASGPIINTSTAADGNQIRVGMSDGTASLTMNSGTMNVGEWLMIGIDASGQAGTFTMNGGTINLGATTPGNGHLWIGYSSSGTFTMNSGTINTPGGHFGLAFGTNGAATVHLNGGTITANFFSMTSSCFLNITNGTVILNGDRRSTVNPYVTNGWITAFGGTGTVSVDYDITNPGKTTVMASVNLAKARSPVPANNAVDVMPNADLSWTAGTEAASHNVYFGTSSPGTFRGNQTATTFDPGTLDFNTPYYWRIDEVNGPNTVAGDAWTFRTISGLAKNPDPADGALNVALDKVLRWTASPGIASHDVYFGTDVNAVRDAERLEGDLDGSGQVNYNDLFILTNYWLEDPAGSEPFAGVNDDDIVDFADYALLANNWKVQASPVFKGNQDANSYDPNLVLNTTYYWRVDEVNGPENRKGDVWRFTTGVSDEDYTLVGKIMCGYQGWFNTPSDGAGRGWVHWGNSSFSPISCNVDLWPDMTEYGVDEKFLASAFDEGSNHFYVFSPYKRNTVLRHFQWMSQYGIDGVYLQRFATELTPGSLEFNHRNVVLSHCKEGANIYGRKYAVMYDLSGLGAGGTQKVIDDWKYLVDTMHIGRDPDDNGYMTHKGKPVVSVWGIGFNDGRQYTLSECLALVNFLKNDPVYGGCMVMVGVPTNWRTLDGDCVSDPMVHTVILAADIVSPWLVGRYGDTTGVNNWATRGTSDKSWCDANGKDYLPVMFPGFSWHNMHDGSTPLNQIPRNGGQFLWDQVKADISIVGANMIYVAMFDEVDEGTAIFKVTNDPPRPGGVDMFVTYDIDGYPLPSDEYLWLVGQAARGLRGEIPVNQTRPAR